MRAAAPQSWTLEQNLALMAGAGAGKTYSLITLCLHLLGGARPGATPLRPSRLCLLTFTDKAAAELRQRLRERLDPLATGQVHKDESQEAELRTSFSARGELLPPPDFWRRIRDDLGAATVGTFHSLCVQLLRRAPAGFGVDPAFELLEERAAAELIVDTAERVLIAALEEGDAVVEELCRDLGFDRLVGAVVDVFNKLREEGASARGVHIGDEVAARADLDEAIRRVKSQLGLAQQEDLANGGKYGAALADASRALDGLTADTFLEPARHPSLVRAISGLRRDKARPERSELKTQVCGDDKEKRPSLLSFYGALKSVRAERAVLGILERVAERHREELARQGALDFSELLIRSRDLLRDHPIARREVQDRFGALLVDEFQDTNRLQLELVTLLAERRDGAPRLVEATPESVLALPLEPAFLCAVGDRKQSIYEFRGADVSVFGKLAAHIEAEGGTRRYLTVNRRSTAALLAFFNRLFARVMQPGSTPAEYEVAYVPDGDDLAAHRSARVKGPAVQLITYEAKEDSEETRQADAEAVARAMRALLSNRSGVKVERKEGVDSPRGGDIAILFRRFSYLELYRQALFRAGIPHRVVRGRGFYGAQEVIDLASLLAVLGDPSDNLSFAAVLRSPLVCLSDASLFKVALAQNRKLDVEQLGRTGLGGWQLPEDERARLSRFLELYPRLRREKDRLGLKALLQVAIEETGFRTALAGMPYGEQALANVEKLLSLAGRRDAAGRGDVSAFSAELLELADAEPSEAQADVLDVADPRAVQLLTIHQSKGLEWPIVIVPDLGAKPRAAGGDVVSFDRSLGLGVHPYAEGERLDRPPRLTRICDELTRRARAESIRLLYVALTRARDHLVLSGTPQQPANTWRKLVDEQLAADPELREMVQDVPLESLPPLQAPPPVQPDLAMDGHARVEAAVARVRQRPPPKAAQAVLPVTHLHDYALCPRRYLYVHQVGLSEVPSVFEVDPDAPVREGAGALADPRTRGTVVHALLERVPLSLIGDEKAVTSELRAMVAEQGFDPDDEAAKKVLGWARAFLRTPFAARMKAAPERVHRELPFVLRIGAAGPGSTVLLLKGQIDLLVEDEEGGAVVVDYKSSRRHPEGLTPYSFQLDCYALAARRFVKDGVRIRTGIAFLQDERPNPELREASSPDALDGFERGLAQSAAELLARSRAAEWPGLERATCQHLHCGYQYRCHPVRGA